MTDPHEDLVEALREAREALVKIGVPDGFWPEKDPQFASMAVVTARKALARIDAALSATSDEASGEEVDLIPMPKAEFFAAVPRPAPSEAPNVERDRIAELEAKISGLESLRPIWALGFSSASVSAQVTGVALASLWEKLSADNQTKAVLALDALHARIAELEKERDVAIHHAKTAYEYARAEGIAAERERVEKVVMKLLTVNVNRPITATIKGLILATIRGPL